MLAQIRSRQGQTCVKYRSNIICIKRKTDVNTRDLKNLHTQNVQIRLIFQTISLISPKIYLFFLSPYAWLECHRRYCSFGTNISGSLSFSPVLWVLSSCNTLFETHSDTASLHMLWSMCIDSSTDTMSPPPPLLAFFGNFRHFLALVGPF